MQNDDVEFQLSSNSTNYGSTMFANGAEAFAAVAAGDTVTFVPFHACPTFRTTNDMPICCPPSMQDVSDLLIEVPTFDDGRRPSCCAASLGYTFAHTALVGISEGAVGRPTAPMVASSESNLRSTDVPIVQAFPLTGARPDGRRLLRGELR